MIKVSHNIISNMKKFVFLGLLVALLSSGCRANIETHVFFPEIKLPLTGVQSTVGSIEFYVSREFQIEKEEDITLDQILWSYEASSRGRVSYEIKISAHGEDSVGLFAACSPENLCLPIRNTYGSPPPYVVNAPVIFTGQINGGVHSFSDIPQNAASLRELQDAIESGKIWVIVKVTTNNPLQFIQGDTLRITNLRGDISLHKNLDYFFPFSGIFF